MGMGIKFQNGHNAIEQGVPGYGPQLVAMRSLSLATIV